MELLRVILLGALLLVSFSLWNAWQKDYPPQKLAQQSSSTLSSPATKTKAVPVATAAPTTGVTPTRSEQIIHVKTDVLDVAIDLNGGNIIQAKLLQYPKDSGKFSEPFLLLNNNPELFYVAQSGLISERGPDSAQGTKSALYRATQKHYTLASGQGEMIIDLVWKGKDGLVITKYYKFKKGDYAIDVNYLVDNATNQPWAGQLYTQIERKKPASESGSFLNFNISAYTGAAISSPEKPYEKISFDKMAKENLDRAIKGGWIAMQQHYFLTAWIPLSQDYSSRFYSRVTENNFYTIGMVGPVLHVAPGEKTEVKTTLYTGPELPDRLKALAPGLDLTVDYGVLWPISAALFWVMKSIYNLIGNWGWTIVLVTLLIKLGFYWLSASSYRSMAAMRSLQPRLIALKDRYGDDRQKLGQATMELYKKEKINPLGGCLPILVQIPVFIALYYVLLESVQLRQAPFILWIQDLSIKDPYYVLPGIMGLTIFLQQRLNPAPADPIQAKVMMVMPLLLTGFFLSFPAGLVLYWVANNTLSIIQQWFIMSRAEKQVSCRKLDVM